MDWRLIIELIAALALIVLADRFVIVQRVMRVIIRAIEDSPEEHSHTVKIIVKNYAIVEKILDPLNQILINMELRDPKKDEI